MRLLGLIIIIILAAAFAFWVYTQGVKRDSFELICKSCDHGDDDVNMILNPYLWPHSGSECPNKNSYMYSKSLGTKEKFCGDVRETPCELISGLVDPHLAVGIDIRPSMAPPMPKPQPSCLNTCIPCMSEKPYSLTEPDHVPLIG